MILRSFAVLLVGAGTLLAQRLPTTLDQLVRNADVVVRARVLGFSTGTSGTVRVGFLTQELLVGDAPRTFALEESQEEGCARAFRGLVPNLGVVLFLERGANGELRLVHGDPNAAWDLEPALLDRLRASLATPLSITSLDAAVEALSGGSRRLRLDAAHSLAQSPDLAAMSPAARDRLQALLPTICAEVPALFEPLGRTVERLDDPRLDTRFALAAASHSGGSQLALVDRLLARRSSHSRERLLDALTRDGTQTLRRPPQSDGSVLPRFRAIRPYRP
ncbi:MAG: hypothetical protein AB7T19_00185 [Planctomycetota bacterium]